MLIVRIVFAGLLISIAGALLGNAGAAVGTLLYSVAWFAVNGPAEGKVLLTLSRDHGVTVADLFSVAGVVIGFVSLTRH